MQTSEHPEASKTPPDRIKILIKRTLKTVGPHKDNWVSRNNGANGPYWQSIRGSKLAEYAGHKQAPKVRFKEF